MTRLRVIAALLAGAGWGAALGAEPGLLDPGPDAELLEFLGSWDGEDDEWQEFFDNLPAVLDEASPIDEPDEPDDTRTDNESD